MPESEATVPVFDRCFRYGDGLFETLRVYGGVPFGFELHLERLKRGAEFLRIRMPYLPSQLKELAMELIHKNSLPEAVLRIQLSRGVGRRGYTPSSEENPFLVMTIDSLPVIVKSDDLSYRLITSPLRLPLRDPLSAFKTCNKLVHILAAAEAHEQNAQDALFLNASGDVVETTCANIFWIKDHVISTPPLSSGALPGVTRALIMGLCSKLGVDHRECNAAPDDLLRADGVFLTQSVREIIKVTQLDESPLPSSPLLESMLHAYQELRCQGLRH